MKVDEENGRDALPELFKDYTLRSCLKYTSETRVYLVEMDGERYILKRAEGAFAAPLREEYAVLTTLNYDFLPRALDCVELEGVVWLLRTYKEGRTLAQMVERRGPLCEQEATRAALAVCHILTQLHGQVPPVIHRDIKPGNIVISSEGTYSLIDMGTARRWRGEAGQDTMVLGTRATAAPEQFGYAQTDMRADIYSMGMLLAFLTTGGYGRARGDLRALSPPLQKIILKCTAFDPNKRYSSATELARALRKTGKNRRVPSAVIPLAAGFAGALLGLWLGRTLFLPAPVLLPEASPSVSQLSAGTAVVFQEPLIEKAVRLQLGKKEDEPVYSEELDKITGLYICGSRVHISWAKHEEEEGHNGPPAGGSVRSLEDLRRMPNLTELVADGQQIQDLTPLKGLPLYKLSLNENPISDLTPLSETNIGVLRIDSITDADLTPLLDLDLRSLSVSNLGSKGLEQVASFTDLNCLYIHNSGLTSLEPLFPLTRLTDLDIYSNSVRNLNGVEVFTNLKWLQIGQNPISDITPLTGVEGLARISVSESQVTDFAVLAELPALKEVTCTSEQAPLVLAVRPEVKIYIWDKT